VTSAFENLATTTYITLRICETLRQRGVEIGLQQSIICLEAIAQYNAIDKDDLRRLYRTTLINRKQDLWALHLALEDVLNDHLNPQTESEDQPEAPRRAQRRHSSRQFAEDYLAALSDPESAVTEGYSIQEVDRHKDFRFISRVDAPAILKKLRKIAKMQATLARRKFKRTNKNHGRVDLRASIRQTAKFDGEVLDWRFKRKLPTRSRFLIIADVSGSMEVYSLFLLNFLHHLNSSRHMKIESFVFSTRLERLTREFSIRNFNYMLRKITETFSGWSGGTKIGAAIEALNVTYGALVTPKTSVLIMSDGWDTGDAALLDQEMDRLRRRAKSIIWINPLKGAATYEPSAQGMATALPYCDRLIAGHSLHSLEELAAILAT
jgi:uncharacterized protein